MALGPTVAYESQSLPLLLRAVEMHGVRVSADDSIAADMPSFWFRRGWGLVHGCQWSEGEMHFGFGHGLNPLCWISDKRLLSDILTTFQENGARQAGPSRA